MHGHLLIALHAGCMPPKTIPHTSQPFDVFIEKGAFNALSLTEHRNVDRKNRFLFHL